MVSRHGNLSHYIKLHRAQQAADGCFGFVDQAEVAGEPYHCYSGACLPGKPHMGLFNQASIHNVNTRYNIN